IFNLLLNAMDELEELEMETSPDDPFNDEKDIWIDVIHEPDRVRILVEDFGSGVPPDLQERIFDPFVSSKKHGTGLGLSVSYGIMEKHQGSLSLITPQRGEGACFEMVIPYGVGGQDG